jgi:hypothetical protein
MKLYARVSARIGALRLDAELAAESGPLVVIGPNGG